MEREVCKLAIIINGKGGSGKDTCIEGVQALYGGEAHVNNVSTIDPIKEAAKVIGWDGSKDDKSRKFLADLKKLSTEYNDYPNQYIKDKIEHFKYNMATLLFIHCREPENIKEIEKYIMEYNIPYTTILVKRETTEDHEYGNMSDDNVDNYTYNEIFDNSFDNIISLKINFIQLIQSILYDVYPDIK